MISSSKKNRKQVAVSSVLSALLGLYCQSVLSAPVSMDDLKDTLKKGHLVVQAGGFWSAAGQEQFIEINDMVGDRLTLSKSHQSNGLFGIGYFLDGLTKDKYSLSYGLNAFYLAKISVGGSVFQENEFENLTYNYNITNFPLYAMAKSTINMPSVVPPVSVDIGIGPNFMRTTSFSEQNIPVGSAISLPNEFFSNKTTATFSATAGASLNFHHVFGDAPLECGYRFFYLGQGSFDNMSDQVKNTLKTGTVYANAVMCSIVI
jgi:hypothetical protein|tara:strand:- start:31575 stop:32357 length:783 start_codon:yes stop_codon:yes gene_type:complete